MSITNCVQVYIYVCANIFRSISSVAVDAIGDLHRYAHNIFFRSCTKCFAFIIWLNFHIVRALFCRARKIEKPSGIRHGGVRIYQQNFFLFTIVLALRLFRLVFYFCSFCHFYNVDNGRYMLLLVFFSFLAHNVSQLECINVAKLLRMKMKQKYIVWKCVCLFGCVCWSANVYVRFFVCSNF